MKLSAFGDIIHALPALDDVLARPEVSEVHWLVDTRFAFVTEVLPENVKVHQIALKGKHPVREVIRVVKSLKAENFDFALDLQGLIKSAVLARLICKKVYGFDTEKIREKPASWMQSPVSFHEGETTITQQCRKIAQAPWLSGDTSQTLIPYQAPKVHRKFKVVLPDVLQTMSPWVVLNLGGSFATKELPDATWLQLARLLVEAGYHIVWCWGSESEEKKAKQLNGNKINGNQINKNKIGYVLPKRLTLPELCEFFSLSFAVVAADTGILHLASAAGAATVSFWGPTPCLRNAPQGKRDQHVESKAECGPCIQKTCDNFICMDMIKAEALFKCIKNIESWSK